MYPYVIPHHNVCNHISSIIMCATVNHSLHCLQPYSPTYICLATYVHASIHTCIICSVYIHTYVHMMCFTVIRTFAGARYFVLFSGSQYKELQPLVMVSLLYVYRHTVHVLSCIGTIYTLVRVKHIWCFCLYLRYASGTYLLPCSLGSSMHAYVYTYIYVHTYNKKERNGENVQYCEILWHKVVCGML